MLASTMFWREQVCMQCFEAILGSELHEMSCSAGILLGAYQGSTDMHDLELFDIICVVACFGHRV